MDCPICQSRTQRRFAKHDYWIRQCQVCVFEFAELIPDEDHIATVYSDRYFQGGEAGYPDYLAEAHLLKAHGARYARLLQRYTSPATLLDIGAAAGFILQGFIDRGWQGKGLEPNAQMVNYGREVLAHDLEQGHLEGFQDHQQYHLISMIQVVAHFTNLQQAFQVAAQHTHPQGFWLIETWNRNSLTAKILGKHWHEYSPPSVLYWFSPQDLKRIAQQHGFQEVARGRPQKWLNGAHAKSLLQYKLQDLPLGHVISQWLNLIPDSLKIPYPAEDLFWILFQRK